MHPTLIRTASLLALLALAAPAAHAQFDPARAAREAPGVAARFAAPAVRYDTPAFAEGRTDLTSHVEVLQFIAELGARAPAIRSQTVGASQQGRLIPLVLAQRGSATEVAAKPTVLIIGQQHGNEPAGGEAALALLSALAGPRQALLDRVNVLVMPRANPDGAERFARTTASGIDVNRDHLLLRTPEARAIADVLRQHRPQVVLDLHEFTVGGRWIDKFGVVQKYDALLQTAGVGNLEPAVAAQADAYEARLHQALARAGLTTFAYHTTSASAADKVVSMGGVQPDTGRNTGGLRPAVSLLIETRGIGIGRAHLLRRVHTQVLAALEVIEAAAAQGPELVGAIARAQGQAAARACTGELVIAARHSPARMAMDFLDARTGEDRRIEVDWRAAAPLQIDRSRPRPCGYLIAADQGEALATLRRLGVRLNEVVLPARWAVERYSISAERSGARQDARGAIDDGADANVRMLEVRTEAANDVVAPGMWWVGLDQPLAGLISAALEPDSQNGFVANRLLGLEGERLLRVLAPPLPQWLGPPVVAP